MEKKKTLHPRNIHNSAYDFDELCKSFEELKQYVSKNSYGNLSIDFANPDAIFTLNKALLKKYYKIQNYNIPKAYLCPPIPGRADYIHYIADLFKNNKNLSGVDIGVGANCIYPIIGISVYGWKFTVSDIEQTSIDNVKSLIASNDILKNSITPILQTNIHHIFNGIIDKNKHYDFTMCNPPFHSSKEEALKGSKRKVQNLTKKEVENPTLNFAGQSNELWCKGGEAAFIKKMIKQSVDFKNNVTWFTTLVSKKENLKNIYKTLKFVKAKEHKTIEMIQGNKTTRVVAWRFN